MKENDIFGNRMHDRLTNRYFRLGKQDKGH